VRISTGFVESTVKQVISKRFCKRQQMQWTTRGTHLLLQTRVKTLNQELGAVFQRWYPDLQLEEVPLAACPPAFRCAPNGGLVRGMFTLLQPLLELLEELKVRVGR
jgi:hypothetical protein